MTKRIFGIIVVCVVAMMVSPAHSGVTLVNDPQDADLVILEGETLVTEYGAKINVPDEHFGGGNNDLVSFQAFGGSNVQHLFGDHHFNLLHGLKDHRQSISYKYYQDGVYKTAVGATVSLEVHVADDLHFGTFLLPLDQVVRYITVGNVRPFIVTMRGSGTYSTSEEFAFSVVAGDPGIYDVLSYGWDLDNDGEFDDFDGPKGRWSYATSGNRIVTVEVTDDAGASVRQSFEVNIIPEPTTLALMGLGLAGIGYKLHRSKKAA